MVFTTFENQLSKSLPDKHSDVQLSYAPRKAVFRSSIPTFNEKLNKSLIS